MTIAAAFATGDAGVMDLALRVPAGTTARVTLPSAGPDTVYVDRVAKTGTVGTDGVTLDVAAGCHILSTRAATGTPETVLSAARACDTTAPALTVPADMDLTSSGPNGTPVTFAATASDVIDEDVPVSCTQASGSTFTVGTTTVTCTATDGAGNTTSRSFTVRVTQVVPVEGGVGGTVPATLSLTLGAPASFGAFTPGVTKDYTAATTANVISTAGDALLSVSDPGHLTNGAFSLPQPLVVELSKSTLDRPGVQRPGGDHVQAAHRRHRRAAHRQLLEDADLHAVYDGTVGSCWRRSTQPLARRASGSAPSERRVAVQQRRPFIRTL